MQKVKAIKSPTSIYIDERYLEWFTDSDGFQITDARAKKQEYSILEGANYSAVDAYIVGEDQGVMTLYEPATSVSVDSPRKSKQRHSKRRSHQIDIDGFIARQKSYPASKKDLLGRAVGRKTETILDATGGWGGDAFHLCSQGFDIRIAERNCILIGFLREAMSRLGKSHWVEVNDVIVPKVIPLDSMTVMRDPSFMQNIDCIYLDPMFPEKRKRSALAKKNMQVLHEIVGEDNDQELLFSTAYTASKRRVIVKRPDYAQSLGSSLGVEPTQVLQGKLMHYDIYLKH